VPLLVANGRAVAVVVAVENGNGNEDEDGNEREVERESESESVVEVECEVEGEDGNEDGNEGEDGPVAWDRRETVNAVPLLQRTHSVHSDVRRWRLWFAATERTNCRHRRVRP